MTNWNDRPLAVIGSGHSGMGAIINALIDIAVRHPATASPVQLHIVNTRVRQPEPWTPYPMNGIAPDDLHPFVAARPPADFPTFGEYVRAMSKEDPHLVGALEAPKYKDVTQYLDFMMELGIIAAGEKVDMIPNRRDIDRIETNEAAGTASILYNDQTILTITPIIAKQPEHMGGMEQQP